MYILFKSVLIVESYVHKHVYMYVHMSKIHTNNNRNKIKLTTTTHARSKPPTIKITSATTNNKKWFIVWIADNCDNHTKRSHNVQRNLISEIAIDIFSVSALKACAASLASSFFFNIYFCFYLFIFIHILQFKVILYFLIQLFLFNFAECGIHDIFT